MTRLGSRSRHNWSSAWQFALPARGSSPAPCPGPPTLRISGARGFRQSPQLPASLFLHLLHRFFASLFPSFSPRFGFSKSESSNACFPFDAGSDSRRSRAAAHRWARCHLREQAVGGAEAREGSGRRYEAALCPPAQVFEHRVLWWGWEAGISSSSATSVRLCRRWGPGSRRSSRRCHPKGGAGQRCVPAGGGRAVLTLLSLVSSPRRGICVTFDVSFRTGCFARGQ